MQLLHSTKLFLGIVGLASTQLFQKSTVLLVHWREIPLQHTHGENLNLWTWQSRWSSPVIWTLQMMDEHGMWNLILFRTMGCTCAMPLTTLEVLNTVIVDCSSWVPQVYISEPCTLRWITTIVVYTRSTFTWNQVSVARIWKWLEFLCIQEQQGRSIEIITLIILSVDLSWLYSLCYDQNLNFSSPACARYQPGNITMFITPSSKNLQYNPREDISLNCTLIFEVHVGARPY